MSALTEEETFELVPLADGDAFDDPQYRELLGLAPKAGAAQAYVAHLPGQHDQSSHGRKRRSAPKTAVFERLTPDAAEAMQRKMLDGNPWTVEQRNALEQYTKMAYSRMNAIMRGRSTDRWDPERLEEARQLIEPANAAMRPLPQPVRVTRYADLATFGLKGTDPNEAVKAIQGKTYQDAGFISATVDDQLAGQISAGQVLLDIEVPAGTPAAYVDSLSVTPGEHELVIGPGQKFEVLSASYGGHHAEVKIRVVS